MCQIYERFPSYGETLHTFKKCSRNRPNDKPWYDHEIRHFSSKRDRVKRKLIKSGSNYLREQYRKLRNKVNNVKKHTKEIFVNNLESSLTDFYSNDKNNSGKLLDILLRIITTLVQSLP